MKYGVVLPSGSSRWRKRNRWRRARRSWGWTASSSPITSWPSPPPPSTTAATGRIPSRCSPSSRAARGASASAPASSCSPTATRWSRPSPRPPWIRPRAAASSSASGWAGTRPSSSTCGCRSPRAAGSATTTSAPSRPPWPPTFPQYSGKYVSFSGATFSPRPVQRPHPPIWVGGSPGAVSGPALRRCAELGDAWHPLALGLDDIEKGYATLRDLATRTGRRDALGLAPRNLLDLTDRPRAPAAPPSRARWPKWPPTSGG